MLYTNLQLPSGKFPQSCNHFFYHFIREEIKGTIVGHNAGLLRINKNGIFFYHIYELWLLDEVTWQLVGMPLPNIELSANGKR